MRLLAIDFKKLTALLLPTFLRALINTEFIGTFMPAISDLQTRFLANRESNLYMLKYNGQVCHLRKVLNDAFPERNKTFLIEDYEPTGQWVYAKSDEFIDSQLMITDQPETMIYSVEVIGDYANFIVRIPQVLGSVDNMNRIRSIVNTYKLLSKKAIYAYY